MMIGRYLKGWFVDEEGASAVEFALVSPFLLLLLIGVVDLGSFITERFKVQNAIAAAAEYVAEVQDDANVQVVAQEAYNGDFSAMTVTSDFECECGDGVAAACPVACGTDDYQRRFVVVGGQATFEPLFPYPGIPASIVLQSTSRVRVD